MANWCENEVIIRGPADEIKRYKDSLLKDATGKYYPAFIKGQLPELKDEDEVMAYAKKESNTGNVHYLHYRAIELNVKENSPEELELHFDTAYSKAANLGPEELFPKLSILHKYFEPMNNFHGFVHFVKGKVIAEGHEHGEEQDSPWQMYDYKPWPANVNPLQDKLKDYIVIPCNQLRPIEELVELLKKKGSV